MDTNVHLDFNVALRPDHEHVIVCPSAQHLLQLKGVSPGAKQVSRLIPKSFARWRKNVDNALNAMVCGGCFGENVVGDARGLGSGSLNMRDGHVWSFDHFVVLYCTVAINTMRPIWSMVQQLPFWMRFQYQSYTPTVDESGRAWPLSRVLCHYRQIGFSYILCILPHRANSSSSPWRESFDEVHRMYV